MSIFQLGFTKDKLNNDNNFLVARVIGVNKESYIINDGKTNIFAKVTGNLMFTSDSTLDFPTVGDFVLFQSFDNDSTALIHKVIERNTILKRKTAGKKIDFQLIAANVDVAFVIQSLDNDFNVNRLERYLAMLNEFEVEQIILLSKADLQTEAEINTIIDHIARLFPSVKIIPFSNLDSNISQIESSLIPRKTYCLIGSSGVGKTTLLNKLIGENKFFTQEVRETDSKGKHSTTNRQLVLLANGAMIIDTPGMRELGNFAISEGINRTFDEISSLTEKCKFNNCTHTVETGCAVLEALENNLISEKRYNNFIKLKKETDYYERSYVERRKRDKDFGKMIKSILKNKKNR